MLVSLIKKSICQFFILTLLGTVITGATAEAADLSGYQDMNTKDKHWYYDTMSWGVQQGIVTGYEENGYKWLRPQQQVTEAEFLAMLLRFYPQTKAASEKLIRSITVSDWTDSLYQTAALFRIPVLGAQNLDHRHLPVKRGQVAQMIASAFGNSYSIPESIQFLYKKELTEGRTAQTIEGFEPDGLLTRAEAVRFLERLNDKGYSYHFISPEASIDNSLDDDVSKSSPLSRLGIYYGTPSLINGAGGDVSKAVQMFEPFEMLILGDGVEHPNYWDWDNSSKVIHALVHKGKKVYGYVDLGVKTTNHSYTQMETAVDEWKQLGAAGIYLDNAGFDFGVTRERQSRMIDYIHRNGLNVFMGAWNPDDVNGDFDENGKHEPSRVGKGDWYLSESWLISKGSYMPMDLWQMKTAKCSYYREKKGIQTAVVSTVQANSAKQQDGASEQYALAWWAAAMYGFPMQWTDFHYSAGQNVLLHYPDLTPDGGRVVAQQPVTISSFQTVAQTTKGFISIFGDGASFGNGLFLPQLLNRAVVPIIDGNGDDWSEFPTFEQSTQGALKVITTGSGFRLLRTVHQTPVKPQLFIRTNFLSDQGINIFYWNGFHADFLLEGSSLYRYCGDGKEWKWTLIKTLDASAYMANLSGDTVEFAIDFSDLGLEPGAPHLIQMAYVGDDRRETTVPGPVQELPIYLLDKSLSQW